MFICYFCSVFYFKKRCENKNCQKCKKWQEFKNVKNVFYYIYGSMHSLNASPTVCVFDFIFANASVCWSYNILIINCNCNWGTCIASLEDLGRITDSIRILVPVDRMKQKCFQITTKQVRLSQQFQLYQQPVPCSRCSNRKGSVANTSTCRVDHAQRLYE